MNTYLITDMVDIYNDDATETDSYGDPADNGIPVAFGVRMSLLERTDVTHRPQDSQVDSTQIVAGICPNGTDIAAGYRLHSQTTGWWYLVDHVRTTSGSLAMPVRLRCRRVDQ